MFGSQELGCTFIQALKISSKPPFETKVVDSGENLVVFIPDDMGVFYKLETASDRLACTNVVKTYVDVAHAGGRGDEAAEALLQQRLKPAWVGSCKSAGRKPK